MQMKSEKPKKRTEKLKIEDCERRNIENTGANPATAGHKYSIVNPAHRGINSQFQRGPK